MEWLEHINSALSYIDDNLDGEVSIKKAAQLACCSTYHFQRMFSYIIGIPLSEYLRRRRLTMAAFDLQNGDKVIDVALRYGYDSPTAFNRAFQTIHGISPSVAQKSDAVLKAFPPVSLQIAVKGISEINYRIVEKEGFRVVGIRKKIDEEPDENDIITFNLWEESEKESLLKPIIELINGEPTCLMGLFVEDDSDGNDYCYICGVTDKPVPEGMYEVNVPAYTWAIFSGDDEPSLIHRIYSEWWQTAGYEFAANIEIEVYLDYLNDAKIEIWIPVVKK